MIGPSPKPGSRSRTLRLAAGFLLLVVVVYADPLLRRRNFIGGDPTGYHYPVEKAIHDAYVRGRLPAWISEISGGRPLLANPNAGAFYPIRPLLSPVPFPLAARVFPILHWAAGGIGVMLLLRSLGLSLAGAWVGAVTYVFSGVSVSEALYPNIHPGMALLPWSIVTLRNAETCWRRIVPLSVVWALFLLVGDAFSIALAFFASVLWILTEVPRAERVAAASRLLAALGLAAFAGAPQIVATIAWIPQTHRGVLGLRLWETLLLSISPFRLLEFVVPFPFGAVWTIEAARVWGRVVFHNRVLGLFPSLYAGAFAVVAVVGTWKARSVGVRFGRALLAAGLAISVLPSLVPQALSNWHSPIPLRYPEKFAVAALLALSILAAVGADLRRTAGARLRWPLPVGGILAGLAVAAFVWSAAASRLAIRAVGAPERYEGIASSELPVALAEAALFWMATVVAVNALESGTRKGLLFSLSILTAVPIAANRRIAQASDEDHIFSPTAFARFQQRADPDRRFRTLAELAYGPWTRLPPLLPDTVVAKTRCDPSTWAVFTPVLWGRGLVFNADFDAGDLSRMETLRRLATLAASSANSAPFFGSLGLRWGIRFRDQKPLAGYRRFGGDGYSDWDEHSRAYPEIRLLEGWQEETGALPAVGALQRLGDGEVVIESGTRLAGSARPGSLRVLENTPERLRVETLAPDPTWLFVVRGYWDYRTVLLDGAPVQDYPAQIAFSAVRVPSGRHRIDWREEVPGWTVSRWGPVLFLLSCVWILRPHPRKLRGGPESR